MIEEASRFLAGACQCTVKTENPGVDLLVAFNWDENVQITEPKMEEEVPLTGLGAFAIRPKALSPVEELDPAPVSAPFSASLNEIGSDANLGNESPIWTETSRVESVYSVIPAEVSNSPSFALITLGALAAIVGCITMGWIIFSSSKS